MAVNSKFEAARRASGLTQEDAARACGISKATYVNREKTDADQFRLLELRGLYLALNQTGKPILVDAVQDIFLSS